MRKMVGSCHEIVFNPAKKIDIFFSFFFFNDTATTEIYTLSLHDALPILHPKKKLYKGNWYTPSDP